MRFRPKLDLLEPRETPATVTWNPVGASVDGSAAANWTGGLPGNGDTAVIPDNSNDCNMTGISPLLAKLIVEGDGFGKRALVYVDTLRVGEIDADFADFLIGTKLEARGFGQSNFESCDFSVGEPGVGQFLVSGAAETFVDDCWFNNPVTVDGTLVVSGDANKIDHYNWSVNGALDLQGAVIDNGAPLGSAVITVGGLLTSSAPGAGWRNVIGCKVVVASTGTLRLDAAPATGAGLEVGADCTGGCSLESTGTIEVYGGNTLDAETKGIVVTAGAIKVYPKETATAWHAAVVRGGGDLSSCAVTFMNGTSGQEGRGALAWYGDVNLSGVTVTMTKNWTANVNNSWLVDGELDFDGTNTFVMQNEGLPANPPSTSGSIVFVTADEITGDFSTYSIPARFLHDIQDGGSWEGVRIYWTLQSWPASE